MATHLAAGKTSTSAVHQRPLTCKTLSVSHPIGLFPPKSAPPTLPKPLLPDSYKTLVLVCRPIQLSSNRQSTPAAGKKKWIPTKKWTKVLKTWLRSQSLTSSAAANRQLLIRRLLFRRPIRRLRRRPIILTRGFYSITHLGRQWCRALRPVVNPSMADQTARPAVAVWQHRRKKRKKIPTLANYSTTRKTDRTASSAVWLQPTTANRKIRWTWGPVPAIITAAADLVSFYCVIIRRLNNIQVEATWPDRARQPETDSRVDRIIYILMRIHVLVCFLQRTLQVSSLLTD